MAMNRRRFGIAMRLWFALCALAIVSSGQAAPINVAFNGLEIGIDEQTGSIVWLASPSTGSMLAASPESAGILDVAYPVDSFPAMRLASRFSRPEIIRGKREITIKWTRLGASRPNLALPGGAVRAEVTIRAADDGRSVIWRCHIANGSEASVPQVLFPDLWGLQPFAGVTNTKLRLARGSVAPFDGPISAGPAEPYFQADTWKIYPAGGYYELNSLRWIDYGSLRGGLSIFQKKWGTEDWPDVITRRTERDPNVLRMAWEHKQEIKPGQSWDSGEIWFTAHPGGWAKGIEVYRDFVRRLVPRRQLPVRVREDIGFQTIWMIQTAETDPAKAVFRFSDLPRIAADAGRYGIHQIVTWGWNTYSTLPIAIRPELGSDEDLIAGVRRGRELGVDIAPFISISIVRNRYAAHYGVAPSNDDWTYHEELIPMFRPYYTKYWNGVEIEGDDALWEKDVSDALAQWIHRGVSSFCWDVFRVHSKSGKEPLILPMIAKIRALARTENPAASFSGESVSHLEFDSQVLDFLWNWRAYEDAAPITNVLSAPRLNCNVERSTVEVTKCFADNLYLNVMPRGPDEPDGTALISDAPQLAEALMQAASLRKQFLPYFVDGTFIGESVLSQPSAGFVRAYQYDGKMLVIALNDQDATHAVSIQSDLALWMPKAAAYRVRQYDGRGAQVSTSSVAGVQWSAITVELQPGAISLFEIGPDVPGVSR